MWSSYSSTSKPDSVNSPVTEISEEEDQMLQMLLKELELGGSPIQDIGKLLVDPSPASEVPTPQVLPSNASERSDEVLEAAVAYLDQLATPVGFQPTLGGMPAPQVVSPAPIPSFGGQYVQHESRVHSPTTSRSTSNSAMESFGRPRTPSPSPPRPSSPPSPTAHIPELPSIADLQVLCCQHEGSMLIKQLIECADAPTRLALCQRMAPSLVNLSADDLGCRVLQTAIEKADDECFLLLVRAFETVGYSTVRRITMDKNGNHVLQRLVATCNRPEYLSFLVQALAQDLSVVDLAKHRYACRVVQKLLQKPGLLLDGQQGSKVPILEGLTTAPQDVLYDLIRDQFGNYSIQCCLEHGRPVDRKRVIHSVLLPCIASPSSSICCDKFASNVLEKSLQFGSDEDRDLMMAALLLPPPPTPGMAFEIQECAASRAMRDQFGNYVIQQCLKLNPKFAGVRRIRDLVLMHAENLRKSKYGWHLVNKARQLALK